MNVKLRTQLSSMMFLNYLIWGFWFVTIITFMTKTLAFSDAQAGLAFSTYAIAAMISPFFVGMVADRFFSTERLLGILHLVGAVLMYALSVTREFTPFFMLLLAYNLVFMPTIPLTNSLSFYHIDDREKQFPGIRVFGTIGWIVAGWVISGMGGETTAVPLQIAAVVSVLMGIYCFTLPHTPPKGKDTHTGIREILGLDALALMKDRSFATVLISSFLICIPLAFYYAWTNVYLIEIGVENTARLQTFGQASETIFLILMPLLFIRLGMKNVMLIGMGSWVLRYVFFALGASPMIFWMVFIGILLHGVCYDFFFVAGQIYVDKATPDRLKSSAQGLLTFATYGLGLYIGTWLSSQVVSSFQTEGGHHWASVWYIPAALAGMVLVGFWMAFKEVTKTETEKVIS
ncbi:MAG: nucleoside permease [Bacteroidia bacterium]